jgi:GAF domain-containing protein/HAMP domain-containing protein
MSTTVTAPTRRPSVRRTLLLFSLALVLLPSLTLGALGATLTYRSQLQNTRDQLSAAADLKRREIDRWVEEREADLSVLATETALQQVLHTMLDSAEGSPEHLAAYSEVAVRLSAFLRKKVAFVELSLLDAETGVIVVSTEVKAEGESYLEETYFKRGQEESYVQPPIFDPAINAPTILIARPVEGPAGDVLAVLVGRANLADLGALIRAEVGLGRTGETYLVSKERFYLAGSWDPGIAEPLRTVTSSGIRTALSRRDGAGQYVNYRGEEVLGAYRWLPNLRVALLIEQSRSTAVAAAVREVLTMVIMTLAAAGFASGTAALLTRRIVGPIAELTDAATEIAAGDLQRIAPVRRADEIGVLAQAFNSMTAQLRDSIGGLEQRVAERTRSLQAAAEVARATTSMLDPDELLRQVVNLVRERFNLYYVGLFLLDEEREYAVLQAGTGEAGQRMLAEGHRLKVGGDSMIGQCVARAEARIALDVGEEAVRFDNPLLPHTRSEMALPLRSRGQVIGATTVQSVEAAAFDEADIAAMQTMADQVAVAIDNARLFAEAQAALEKMEATHRRYLRQAWTEYTSARTTSGYRQTDTGLVPLGGGVLPEVHEAIAEQNPMARKRDGEAGPSALVVPIMLRGQPIGALGFRREAKGNQEWSAEDVVLAEAISEQFALAIENLRLVEETQRRAARERLTGEITARMRETLDIETVLESAAREIGQALGLAALDVRLGAGPEGTDAR